MAWTSIAKPGAQSYTNVNALGKEQYDQSDIEYDQADIYYDGINPSQWTDVVKPSYGLTWNDLPIAFQDYNNPWGSPTWVMVNKPQ